MPAACLLSSGFCRRVYASSASERFVSRLSHCRRRRRQRQRRRRLMSVRFAVGHGSSSTSRDDWWPSCYVLRSLFFSRFLPLLFCSLHHSRLVVPSLLFSSIPFLSFSFFSNLPAGTAVIRTSYIYGISWNLRFTRLNGQQSTDCFRCFFAIQCQKPLSQETSDFSVEYCASSLSFHR